MKLGWLAALLAGGVASADPQPPALVRVGHCPDGGYMVDFNCPDFITTPGLPAIDPTGTQVAIGIRSDAGLSTLPNLTVHVVGIGGRTLSTIPMWTQKDATEYAKKLEGKPSPHDVRPVTAAVEARRTKLEAALQGYKPLAKCTRVPGPSDQQGRMSVCGGADHWTCGDLDVRYSTTHNSIVVTQGGASATTDTRSWRHPALEMGPPDQRLTVETLNCITGLARVPSAHTVVVELTHICDSGGDWCYVGDQTAHIIK